MIVSRYQTHFCHRFRGWIYRMGDAFWNPQPTSLNTVNIPPPRDLFFFLIDSSLCFIKLRCGIEFLRTTRSFILISFWLKKWRVKQELVRSLVVSFETVSSLLFLWESGLWARLLNQQINVDDMVKKWKGKTIRLYIQLPFLELSLKP